MYINGECTLHYKQLNKNNINIFINWENISYTLFILLEIFSQYKFPCGCNFFLHFSINTPYFNRCFSEFYDTEGCDVEVAGSALGVVGNLARWGNTDEQIQVL